ncbi:unnamed protein product, partial [Closterium sp. NIES-53]
RRSSAPRGISSMPFTVFARNKRQNGIPQRAAFPAEDSPVLSHPLPFSRPADPLATDRSLKESLVLRDLSTSASSALSSSFPSASSSLSSPSLTSSSSRSTSISSAPSSRTPLSLTSPVPLAATYAASDATPDAASLPESTSPSTSPPASQSTQLPQIESLSSASSATPLFSLPEAQITSREGSYRICSGDCAERSSVDGGMLDRKLDGMLATSRCGRDAATLMEPVCHNVRPNDGDGSKPAEDGIRRETAARRISISISPASFFLRLSQSRFISARLRPLRIDLDASTSIRCWLPASAATAAATAAAASRRRAQQQVRWERNPPLLLLHGFGGPGYQRGEQGGSGGGDARNHDGSGEGKGGSAGDAATVHWHQLVGRLARDFELYVPNLVWFGESGVEECEEWGGRGREGVSGGAEESVVEDEGEEENKVGSEEEQGEEEVRLGGEERSREESSKYSIQFQANCMMRLARILGLSRFDVLGFGYGASIAYRMAAQHPGIIRRVILTSPTTMMTQHDLEATLQPKCTNSAHTRSSSSSSSTSSGSSNSGSSSDNRRRRSSDAVMTHGPSTASAACADAAESTPNLDSFSAPSSPRLLATVAELRQAQHAAFEGTFWAPAFLYRDLLKVLFSGSRTQQQLCLEEYIRDRPLNPWLNPVLKQEVLIVCGRKDPIAPLPFGKMLLHHLGVSSRLVLVNDARHMPHAQCPKEFSSLVRYFLHAPHGCEHVGAVAVCATARHGKLALLLPKPRNFVSTPPSPASLSRGGGKW